jgi:hypothetical protein
MHLKIITFLLSVFAVSTIFAESQKSPHGDKFKIDCTVCHVTDGWKKIKENGFNHNKTRFPLLSQHKALSCRQCHPTLHFSDAKTDCSSCHVDIHEGTVGLDCNRCHNTNSWIVNNIRQIHQRDGFVLLGAHASADCNRCHTSVSKLRFDNIRSDCYSCHRVQYENSTAPNHRVSGFGIECNQCHSMSGRDWTYNNKGFDHGFFPLTAAHNIACSNCHFDNDYSVKLSTQCSSCHNPGSARTRYPAHTTKYLVYECNACHNTSSWSGVIFKQHDSWGRIYSGVHQGRWQQCTDCHNNDAAYVANCSKCHDFSTGRLP